jgi:hypothetical protein
MVKRGTMSTGTLDINYDLQGNTSSVSDLARQVKVVGENIISTL